MTRRCAGLVGAWCALYTLAVPQVERSRRRDEMAAHLADAASGWGEGPRTCARLLRDWLLGAVSDLTWCSEVRREHSLPPLMFEMILGPVGGLAVGGVAMTAAFLFSLSDAEPYASLRVVFLGIAAAVTIASSLDRLVRWRRRS